MKKVFNSLFSEKCILWKHGPEGLSSGAESEPNAVKLEFRTEQTVDDNGKVLDPAHKFLIWNKSIDEEFKRKSENLYWVGDKSPLKAGSPIRRGNYEILSNGALMGTTEWVTYKTSPEEGDYRVALNARGTDSRNDRPVESPSTEILLAFRFTGGKWVRVVMRSNEMYFDGKAHYSYPLRWEAMNPKEQSKWKREALSGIPITPEAEREYERKGIPFMPNPHRLNNDTTDESEGK